MYNFFQRHTLLQGDYPLNTISIDYQLGRGNSQVYTAKIKSNTYALKQIEIKTDYQYQSFLKQITLMKDLSHTCSDMIKYQGYFLTLMEVNQYQKHKYAFIVMECAQMNLQQFITQKRNHNKRFRQFQLQKAIEFMLGAFLKLQQINVAHCDIKPENVLILNYQKMQMKLCDVGSCKVVSKQNAQEATILGTVPFLAPQLFNMNSKNSSKIVSANPFKSDVFSFGLVVLYMFTFKKFKSNQRVEIDQGTYHEIINQWIRQARELGANQIGAGQILKLALQFDQNKRPLFKQLNQVYWNQKKKKKDINQKQTAKLQEIQHKIALDRMNNSKNYDSIITNNSNTNKRGLRKSIAKTSTNGFMLKSQPRQPLSPSPLSKRKRSQISPQKSIGLVGDFKRIIYVTQQTKQRIPFQQINSQQKIFVLSIPFVNFKRADIVTILKNCQLGVIYSLADIQGRQLYIDYNGVQGIGLSEDCPTLNFKKISMNVQESSLLGGYKGLIKAISCSSLQSLQIRISGSDFSFDQVMYLLEKISILEKLQSFLFCWQNHHISQDMHFNITQKISKCSNLKKLILLMNENFIQIEKQTRWVLPKKLETLYLQYDHNFLAKIISNLSNSLSQSQLRQLYISLQNNNLTKGQLHNLFSSIIKISFLQKLMINISRNKLDDLKYISNTLIQFNSININVLELKMHHIEVGIEDIIDLIGSLKQLFQFKLKILKISCDRKMKRNLFINKIQQVVETGKIKLDVIGMDNKFYIVYLKKKDKKLTSLSNTIKNPIGLKLDISGQQSKGLKKQKDRSSNMFNLISTQQPLKTISNTTQKKIQQTKNQLGCCMALYRPDQSFDNYLCLTCCEFKQSYKTSYFCKWCIQHCSHKGHSIVKVYSRNRCCCAYSGCCVSQVKQLVCAQQLGVKYKKQFKCLKCDESVCIGCVQWCKNEHQKWIVENKDNGMRYFECMGKRGATKFAYESDRFLN